MEIIIPVLIGSGLIVFYLFWNCRLKRIRKDRDFLDKLDEFRELLDIDFDNLNCDRIDQRIREIKEKKKEIKNYRTYMVNVDALKREIILHANITLNLLRSIKGK